MEYRNVIGAQVKKLRVELDMSQEELAGKLQLSGLFLDRSQVSKIEGRTLRVHDYQQVIIAEALKVKVEELFPPEVLEKPAKVNVWKAINRDLESFDPDKPSF